MQLTITNTARIVTMNDIPCRVWEGTTSRGVKVTVLIPRVAVKNDQDQRQFEAELKEQPAPASADAVNAFPLRMML